MNVIFDSLKGIYIVVKLIFIIEFLVGIVKLYVFGWVPVSSFFFVIWNMNVKIWKIYYEIVQKLVMAWVLFSVNASVG